MRALGLLFIASFFCACAPDTVPLEPRGWRAYMEEVAPDAVGLAAEQVPIGDWRLALESGLDWSLISVDSGDGTCLQVALRPSAWSETTQRVSAVYELGVIVLSAPLELVPHETVRALYPLLVEGHEMLVPDTRLALLAGHSRPPTARAGFVRFPAEADTIRDSWLWPRRENELGG